MRPHVFCLSSDVPPITRKALAKWLTTAVALSVELPWTIIDRV